MTKKLLPPFSKGRCHNAADIVLSGAPALRSVRDRSTCSTQHGADEKCSGVGPS